MTQWVREAVDAIHPAPEHVEVKYSGKFKEFNGNVRYTRTKLIFSLSSKWKDVDSDIQAGIIQHLTAKVYKINERTMYMDMYEEFVKQAGKYSERKESDPELIERFHVINEEYFDGLMDMPVLTWGQASYSKLGSYDFAGDTVRISTILREDQDMLDYVLYHELLHKKHQFTCSGTKTMTHTKAFRADERKFRIPDAEARLHAFVGKARSSRKKRKSFWFF